MAKSELQLACEELGITITSVHLYVDYGDEKYPRDKWSCTLRLKDRAATFEYYSGVGHRVVRNGVVREGNGKYVARGTGDVARNTREAIEKGFLILKCEKGKVVGPNVADVLSCLLSDAEACETTFDDWCSNMGGNNDSIKALNTYICCQRNGSRLIRLLGYEVFKELQGKEH